MQKILAVSCLFILLCVSGSWAQTDPSVPAPVGSKRTPPFAAAPESDARRNQIKLHVITRVLDEGKKEVWKSDSEKFTIPGRPIGLKVVGDNLVVVVQFTPYPRRNGKGVLVAQGQIWVDVPGEGVQYKTTMQTVPLDYGERVFFFPLGSDESNDSPHIEIQVEMSRNERNAE